MDMLSLADILHKEKCSCVIWNNGSLSIYHERGIKDLYSLLTEQPDVLKGAMIADKVIGKGAAALMILGGVKTVYTDVISSPAMDLFAGNGIEVRYGKIVANIINRSGDGICPVEKLCLECNTAEACLPQIRNFIKQIHNANHPASSVSAVQ